MADRRFYMEPKTDMASALQTIRAALDDEDLELGPRCGSQDMVTSVTVEGESVFIVPEGRISPKGWNGDRRG